MTQDPRAVLFLYDAHYRALQQMTDTTTMYGVEEQLLRWTKLISNDLSTINVARAPFLRKKKLPDVYYDAFVYCLEYRLRPSFPTLRWRTETTPMCLVAVFRCT